VEEQSVKKAWIRDDSSPAVGEQDCRASHHGKKSRLAPGGPHDSHEMLRAFEAVR
jgi:hypothetical protein